MIVRFPAEDNLEKIRFFKEIFLLAQTILEIMFEILFLTLAKVQFLDKKALTWWKYLTADALLTQKRVEIVNSKEFAKLALRNKKAFVVHISTLFIRKIEIKALKKNELAQVHPFYQTQIFYTIMGKKVKIFVKYLDNSDVFLTDFVAKLREHNSTNDHAIDIELGKQPFYKPIYSLGYQSFLLECFFFFIRKKDGSLKLCVDYWGLNNIIIKNKYPFPLIGEFLNCLSYTKRVTYLDLINAYHQMRICKNNE